MIKRILFILLGVIGTIALVYFVGPTYPLPDVSSANPYYQSQSYDVKNIEQTTNARESVDSVKVACRSEIIWADSINTQTEYAIVYLHGFGACTWEGSPSHIAIADSLNMNLYLHRIQAHGLSIKDPLLTYKSNEVLEGVADALAIGKSLGKKVILMSMSTGGTYSLWLAAKRPHDIAGLLMFSPNIRVADPKATLMISHWGTMMANKVFADGYREWSPPETARPYYYARQRFEGAQEMVALLETTMQPSTFRAVSCPTLVGCYYQDKDHQDPVVSVEKMRWMYEELNTPDDQKQFIEYACSKSHNILNPVFTDCHQDVVEDAIRFVRNKIQ